MKEVKEHKGKDTKIDSSICLVLVGFTQPAVGWWGSFGRGLKEFIF